MKRGVAMFAARQARASRGVSRSWKWLIPMLVVGLLLGLIAPTVAADEISSGDDGSGDTGLGVSGDGDTASAAISGSDAGTVSVPEPAPRTEPGEQAQAGTGGQEGTGAVVPNEVLVELAVPFEVEAELDQDRQREQREGIAAARAALVAELEGTQYTVTHSYDVFPYVAVRVSPEAEQILAGSQQVAAVHALHYVRPLLTESVPLIDADNAWDTYGATGEGTTIAVLDTGIDKSHASLHESCLVAAPGLGPSVRAVGRLGLNCKVVNEACFTSLAGCPDGSTEQHGSGSAAPCDGLGCFHGTFVAGIAASDGDDSPIGVAPDADIQAVQVFDTMDNWLLCVLFVGALYSPCEYTTEASVLAGLEHVVETADDHNTVAVNLSLGSDAYTAPCGPDAVSSAVDVLKGMGIATIAATGNDGEREAISWPACLESVISVGASTDVDEVASFSNTAYFMDLFAPGEDITSAVSGGGDGTYSGTSASAPHVAGAFAIAREEDASFDCTVSEIEYAMEISGTPITVTGTSSYDIPRLDVDNTILWMYLAAFLGYACT